MRLSLAETRSLLTLPDAWRAPAIRVAAALCALLIAFAGDWAAMAHQWSDSSTYNHITLIPAILAWLVWQRRSALAEFAPQAWLPGLALFALAAFGWVLGAFAGFDLLRQLGVVAMGIGAVLALLGPQVGAALAFPLGYALFLVPFGDELVPALQLLTAKMTVALVHLSATPARIDGVFIDTPAGLFEVAEACSGVKFLVAMVAFGVLAANVCFVSWKRRAAFLALCVAAPIFANALRAWGTIYVAQFVGAERAGGFDHLVYGWIFFAVVIASVIAAGWRWFDRPVDAAPVDAQRIRNSALVQRLRGLSLAPGRALAALALCAVAALGWAVAAQRIAAPLPGQVFLPEVKGWTRVDYRPLAPWQPRASGAQHRLLGRYADARGRTVDVFYALYARQGEGAEAGGFGEGALTPETPWAWAAPGPAVPDARSDRLAAPGPVERLAETRYRVGTLTTGSNLRLKLAVIADHLFLRARPTQLLIVSAEGGGVSAQADALADFRRSTGPVGAWMDGIVSGR